MNTQALQIAADVEFCLANADEFLGYDGRVATSKIIRNVAALNADATRKFFTDTMVELGFNRNTVMIQFNQSRKLSAQCGDVVINADGSLTEV